MCKRVNNYRLQYASDYLKKFKMLIQCLDTTNCIHHNIRYKNKDGNNPNARVEAHNGGKKQAAEQATLKKP